jgi:hypothetical protein
MSIKSSIEKVLKICPPLFRLGSNVYHKFNGSFKTLSEGTPEAIRDAFKLALENSDKPVGDYYEFGLFRGYAFLKAFEYSKKLGIDHINFYGFDSFEGLPETTGIDKADGRFFEGQFSCSKEDVEKNLQTNNMDMSRTLLVKGFYKDSLTEELKKEHNFNNASVILLDCDLYSSTIEALDWLTPYLQNGTILLFDDWYSFGNNEDLGQPKALHDFLDKNKNLKTENLWNFSQNGNAFILKNA